MTMRVYNPDPAWIIQHAEGFTRDDVIELVKRDGYKRSLFRSLPMSESLTSLVKTTDNLVYVSETYRRCFVDLGLGADAYSNHFTGKTKSTLRRKIRKFTDACGGTLPWRECRTPSELDEFYPRAREISAQTYQEALLDSGLPSNESFRSSMLRDGAKDKVRAYLLFDNEGHGLAYLYCPIIDGVVRYQYLGYVAGHRLNEWSPGTILLWLALQRLQEEGCYKWFDFTEGSDEKSTGQKSRFATGDVVCADLWVFERTPGSVCLLTVHRLVDNASALLGKVFERLGVKRRLKHWIRRIAATRTA
ncbi:MAG: GNAT family N-acetyltransferase [Bryocella sp.]